jgi:hypothetical protein
MFQKLTGLKYIIDNLTFLTNHFSRIHIAVNASMRFGVIMPKMSPNDRGFELRISDGAKNYFFDKIQKQKINAECSRINSNFHRKIEYDYLH